MVMTLNAFLVRLLISSLLGPSSGVLFCSFLWNVFLCLLREIYKNVSSFCQILCAFFLCIR